MILRWSAVSLATVLVALGLAFAIKHLASRQQQATATRDDPGQGVAAPTSVSGLQVVFPPTPRVMNALGRHELPVTVTNPGPLPIRIEVITSGRDGNLRQASVVPGHANAVVVIPITPATAANDGRTTTVSVLADQREVSRLSLTYATPASDFSGIRWGSGTYLGGGGEKVVLVTPDLSLERRRWSLLRHVEDNALPRGMPLVLWGNEGNRAGDLARLGSLLAEQTRRQVTTLRHDGDPLQALMACDSAAGDRKERAIVLAWGVDETLNRFPLKEFRESLVFAACRLKHFNPSARVALATPPPIPFEAEVSARYAQAVREAARELNLPVIDWHADVVATPDWDRLYLLDEDAAVCGRFPERQGFALLIGSAQKILR